MTRIFRTLCVAPLLAMTLCLTASSVPARAADYWDGYWGWYNSSYRPYYQRRYGRSYNLRSPRTGPYNIDPGYDYGGSPRAYGYDNLPPGQFGYEPLRWRTNSVEFGPHLYDWR